MVAVTACRGPLPDQIPPSSPLTVFTVPRQWEDTGATSTLHVVVRYVTKPIQPVEAAQVLLTRTSTLRLVTDDRGYAKKDSLTAGDYRLSVRRIGYEPLHTTITLVRGCDAWAEVYLAVNPCDLGDCPPYIPARITLSTCANAR